MNIHLSLTDEKARRTFLVFFLLSSLLPLLILLYIVFQYILPLLSADQMETMRDFFTVGILTMLLFPLLGFVSMSSWMASFENMTKEVTAKSSEIMKEKVEDREEGEIFSLKHAFSGLYDELQEKMSQLDEYSNKLLEANQKLSELSIKDELTPLYNRRYFDVRLKEELSRASRYGDELCIIMIDVDDFKQYNDTHGHQTGDSVLQEIGFLIQNTTRMSDMAFRYGGDEFAILLPNCPLERAEEVAKRLVADVSVHPFEDCTDISKNEVSVSCGIASFSEAGENLLKVADSLLLQAKSGGKGRAYGTALKCNKQGQVKNTQTC